MHHTKNRLSTYLMTTVLSVAAPCAGMGEVTGFDVLSRGPAFDAQGFDAGSYERIDAVAHFAVDPKSERAAAIVDIDKAPVNEAGQVEFSTEVVILRPTEAGSGVLFYEVPNRGRNLSFPLLNLSGFGSGFHADDAGDGFLMDQGHTLVWSGWQTGLPEEFLTLDVPVLDGVTGQSREEFIFDDAETVSSGKLSYPASDLDVSKATLTVRSTPGSERETPEGLTFEYVDETTIEITRPEGADGGAIYEFVYPARDAIPAGLAFIATSDLVSYLRGSSGHSAEDPPVEVRHTIGMGISQSGRFVRDLVYQGFNADANGNKVFDGVIPHIAGSRKTFTNYRFAQPGRYSRQHEDHDFPGDQFPFTYVELADPLTGAEDSILAECSVTETCPVVMHSDTSTEFWQARSSLVSTSFNGEPLTMPENVRLYFVAGAPHFSGWGGAPGDPGICVFQSNPISSAPTMRALVDAMAAWVTEGVEPPASVYPGLAAGDLVDPAEIEFPVIDGARPRPVVNALHVMDHASVPPEQGDAYPVRVPAVDADGLAKAGVRLPYMAAATGSYFGWNLRAEGFAPGDLCSLTGSFVPFPADESDDDSRKPLSARYNGQEGYKQAVRSAAEDLARSGLMLESDVDLVVDNAPAFPGED